MGIRQIGQPEFENRELRPTNNFKKKVGLSHSNASAKFLEICVCLSSLIRIIIGN